MEKRFDPILLEVMNNELTAYLGVHYAPVS